MRIKNISSTTIELPEFNFSLKPGDIIDLSSFEPRLIHSNQRLSALFEKGLLLNLGYSTTKNNKKSLETAKQRIDKLNLGKHIVKPAKSSSNNSTRNLISSTLSGTERKPIPKSSESSSRYQQQHQQNTNPTEEWEEQVGSSKKLQIQQHFDPVQITPTGLITPFGSHGIIPSEQLVGQTTYLNQLTISNEIEQLENKTAEIQIGNGNKHKISLENIEKISQRRCIGTNKNGKLCKKWTVIGFNTCPIHMDEVDRIAWEKTKKSTT